MWPIRIVTMIPHTQYNGQPNEQRRWPANYNNNNNYRKKRKPKRTTGNNIVRKSLLSAGLPGPGPNSIENPASVANFSADIFIMGHSQTHTIHTHEFLQQPIKTRLIDSVVGLRKRIWQRLRMWRMKWNWVVCKNEPLWHRLTLPNDRKIINCENSVWKKKRTSFSVSRSFRKQPIIICRSFMVLQCVRLTRSQPLKPALTMIHVVSCWLVHIFLRTTILFE